MFQKDLGSLLDKSDRVEALVTPLAEAMGLQVGGREEEGGEGREMDGKGALRLCFSPSPSHKRILSFPSSCSAPRLPLPMPRPRRTSPRPISPPQPSLR
jgi:hypothetical protein